MPMTITNVEKARVEACVQLYLKKGEVNMGEDLEYTVQIWEPHTASNESVDASAMQEWINKDLVPYGWQLVSTTTVEWRGEPYIYLIFSRPKKA